LLAAHVAAGCTLPASAKYGDSAKIAPGIEELKSAIQGKDEAPKGPSIYDKESIRMQEERIANVDKEWNKLVQVQRARPSFAIVCPA
jgi:hypothetical protein